MLMFYKKADFRKIKGVLVLKVIFSETIYVYVPNVQVSSVILTSFTPRLIF